MILSMHLVQRGKRGIWQLRVPVPRSLHKEMGIRERIVSLGTSDRALAEQKALPILAQWREEERVAAGEAMLIPKITRRVPSGEELEALAVEIGFDLSFEQAERRRREPGGFARHINRTKRALDDFTALAAVGDKSLVMAMADMAIEGLGLDMEPGSDVYEKLLEDLNVTMLAAKRLNYDRARGNIEADTDSSFVRRVRSREQARNATKAKPGETIMELFERWAADRLAKGEKRADTVNQDRKAMRQFVEFVGIDRAVDSIVAIEIADYRTVLRELPPKWRARGALKGLAIRDAARQARELGLAETAFTTVNKHLSTISPLYRWLASQPRWAGLANPCTGLFHDGVKGKNRRPSFSTDQLNAILRSPLFSGFLADGKEHLRGNVGADDWRKWVPLVCMFTGARIGEIAQLRIGDVRQERGVWFVHIRHDEGAGLSTKSGKSRPAALHFLLERMGFLAFHTRQLERVGGDATAALFGELKQNTRGQISQKPSRFWRKYLAAIGVKDRADGFGAHSFRHTLADRLRSEVELLDDQIEVCLGHNQNTVTGGYGEVSQGTVTLFKGWMDRLTFDGVDFSHLVDQGRPVGNPAVASICSQHTDQFCE
jgi:integrase